MFLAIFDKMRNLILLVLYITVVQLNAQDSTKAVIQFSGLVVTGDSLNPVPFTTVYRERDQRGSITDNVGFFSLPAFAGDTIKFSGIGYMPEEYIIPDTLTNLRYNIVQLLSRDTIQLNTTYVYPWPTKERFKQDFLALDIPRTEEELAEKNLEAAMMYERMREIDPSAAEAYRYAITQESNKISYAGQLPTISLMNPIAWAQFIQAWRNGDFKRQ